MQTFRPKRKGQSRRYQCIRTVEPSDCSPKLTGHRDCTNGGACRHDLKVDPSPAMTLTAHLLFFQVDH